MDAIRNSYRDRSSFSGQGYQQVRQKVQDNSTQMTLDGAAGVATFGVIKNSSRIGNSVTKAIETSKLIKADKQAKILRIAGRFKPLAKHLNNPIVRGAASVLAGASAVTALVGSTAKIADTCNYLQGMNPNNN